ncbi:MAG: LysM peptidoglycan-binding domain-containing protein [Chitinophagaceae bacterium]|jgi:LysM repeat protein|nr:LysM peptidoglycan-binding domain-containing protein [Chitinophagaceae bacterium]
MRSLFLFAVLLICGFCANAQSSEFIKDYIARYRDIAIEEMKRSGVPASIKLAQGIHESSAGQSDLVFRSNNHFGIKCKSNWTGESVSHTDDAPNECFRKYTMPEESYKDHSDFLRKNQRYAFLFNLDPTDYEAWANGLKKAGYATNPRYPLLIINLVEEYSLQNYSLIALGKIEDDKKRWMVMNEGLMDKNALATPVIQKDKPVVHKTNIINQYPSGLFKINATKVLFAKKGASYLSIAQQHKIPLSKLFEFNDILKASDEVPFDQLIYVQRKRKAGHHDLHIVVSGETSFYIAQLYAIRLQNLLQMNHLSAGMEPAPGEKIYLRSIAPGAPKVMNASVVNIYDHTNNLMTMNDGLPSAPNAKTLVHNVRPKEGLYAIGKKYGVTVNDLLAWNNLQSDELKVGQKLKILK